MVTIPTTVTSSPEGFQPAFNRVQQEGDFDDAFTCIATITGKTLADIRKLAIDKFRHPAHGPYWVYAEMITSLLAHYGLVATVYKEAETVADLPDLALAMVDYDPETEIGRHTVFHRAKASHAPKTVIEYMIDTAYWVDTAQQVRTDFTGFQPAWYIGVHAMSKLAASGK
ncbi:polysaccharide deacetylase family protein [Cupriavidus sp. 8B]